MEDRQRKGGCLARSGLGDAENIMSLEKRWDRPHLDWRWCGVAFIGKRAQDRLRKAEFNKLSHNTLS